MRGILTRNVCVGGDKMYSGRVTIRKVCSVRGRLVQGKYACMYVWMYGR